MGWITRWSVKSDSDREGYQEKRSFGSLKRRSLSDFYPIDPWQYFFRKLKLAEGRGGIWQAECSLTKAAGGWTKCLSERMQCDSAFTWAPKLSCCDKNTPNPRQSKDFCIHCWFFLSEPLLLLITAVLIASFAHSLLSISLDFSGVTSVMHHLTVLCYFNVTLQI